MYRVLSPISHTQKQNDAPVHAIELGDRIRNALDLFIHLLRGNQQRCLNLAKATPLSAGGAFGPKTQKTHQQEVTRSSLETIFRHLYRGRTMKSLEFF